MTIVGKTVLHSTVFVAHNIMLIAEWLLGQRRLGEIISDARWRKQVVLIH